jgi:hypothetical protein
MLLELNSALGRKNQFPPAASWKEGRQKREKILQQQTNEIEEYLERRGN